MRFLLAVMVIAALCILSQASQFHKNVPAEAAVHDIIADSSFGYVSPKANAQMFYWLYGATEADRSTAPTILWLQGGPGASSSGFGNFEEIGPLDVNLNKRNFTWARVANLLFVDQPVGTGFSYVTSKSAYATSEAQIAADLLSFLTTFLQTEHPELRTNPFWIFSESYGGKMATSFGGALYDAIAAGKININFKGVALGDSWISPIDCMLSYGNFLSAVGQITSSESAKVNQYALQAQTALAKGEFAEATRLWSAQQDEMESLSNNVDVYNFLTHIQEDDGPVTDLMNGPVRQQLGIIPSTVSWGGQSDDVFEYLSNDFMVDVIAGVDKLISSGVQVVVYNGQLDVIVDTPSTEAWVSKLKWTGLPHFLDMSRTPMTIGEETVGFYKSYQNFQFYWINGAGHMIPSDQPEAAFNMMCKIVGVSNATNF